MIKFLFKNNTTVLLYEILREQFRQAEKEMSPLTSLAHDQLLMTILELEPLSYNGVAAWLTRQALGLKHCLLVQSNLL